MSGVECALLRAVHPAESVHEWECSAVVTLFSDPCQHARPSRRAPVSCALANNLAFDRMKYEAVKAFRKKLRANEPLAGLWVTLEAPSITEAAVAFGLDYVVVDAEHGHLDWGIVAGMV